MLLLSSFVSLTALTCPAQTQRTRKGYTNRYLRLKTQTIIFQELGIFIHFLPPHDPKLGGGRKNLNFVCGFGFESMELCQLKLTLLLFFAVCLLVPSIQAKSVSYCGEWFSFHLFVSLWFIRKWRKKKQSDIWIRVCLFMVLFLFFLIQ